MLTEDFLVDWVHFWYSLFAWWNFLLISLVTSFSDVAFWTLESLVEIDNIAAKESIHLHVAVDTFGRLCLLHTRSDQHFARDGVKQVGQLLLLHAHGLHFEEELCL